MMTVGVNIYYTGMKFSVDFLVLLVFYVHYSSFAYHFSSQMYLLGNNRLSKPMMTQFIDADIGYQARKS